MIKKYTIPTRERSQMINITGYVNDAVKESGIQSGLCYIFVPHTTAGVTINENADPTVTEDILKETSKIVPWEDGYKHLEGNSAAHIKASMMGFCQTVFIEDSRLVLGTWQAIYFCEFDGPRSRNFLVKIVPG